jgi:hypothetical protein
MRAISAASAVVAGVPACAAARRCRPVLADQRALHAALFGAAEDVQRAAAQALELRQQAEGLAHPGAVLLLDQLALLVLLGDSGGARWCRRSL